jgi:hypothetical protein
MTLTVKYTRENMIILVVGFGRCGSSLCMQMLNAAGVDCLGEAPHYEDPRTVIKRLSQNWLYLQDGKAVKVLDFHLTDMDRNNNLFIINTMRESAKDQAKSHIKFLDIMSPKKIDKSRAAVRRLQKTYAKDQKIMERAIQRVTPHSIKLCFENILSNPVDEATKIKEFLGLDCDPRIMADVVIDRGPEVQPGLEIEERLSV